MSTTNVTRREITNEPAFRRHSGPGSTPRSLHVLLAGDDEEMRTQLATILEADGHHVTEAFDKDDLLQRISREALEAGEYDVIISDVLVPGVSGLSALLRLNEEPMAPPVVLTAGCGYPYVNEWATRCGVAAVFDEQVEFDDLRTVLLNLGPRHVRH
jgi:CheY-like chemotaxis protein